MRVKIFCKEIRLITNCVWVNRNRRNIIRVNNGLQNSPTSGIFLCRLQDALVAFPQATSSVATLHLPHELRLPRHV